MEIKRVCIIGAGISGLVAAKTFIEDGYQVTVFEKQSNIGGVWERSRTYPELTTHNPGNTYCFTDYPFPQEYPDFPTAEQMRNYLQSYADNFDVTERILFQTEVTNIYRKIGNKIIWIVEVNVKDEKDNRVRKNIYDFDFVLICNGVFNLPKIPKLANRSEFESCGGKILHSSQLHDLSILDKKKVIVVGFGKSATEISVIAADRASSCTLIFRRSLWKIPKYLFNIIPYQKIFFTRFAEIWLLYFRPVGIEKSLHSFGKPLVWAFWRIQEMIVRWKFSLKSCKLIPEEPIDRMQNYTANLVRDSFYKYIQTRKIDTRKAEISNFLPGGVELNSGETLAADIVIFGTGSRQDISFLEEKYRRWIVDEEGNFHLYRHMIHPDIPNLGFLGYNSSIFCQLTSEIGSWWLSQYCRGKLFLPSRSQMYKAMHINFRWNKKNLPNSLAYGICVSPFNFHYLENLIEDMGFNIYSTKSKYIQNIMNIIEPYAYNCIRRVLRNKIN
ncbi:MAG: NAD(P)/FAD-dependent oxidoreductase [Cyanobacteria bacterium J06639_18]